MNVKAKIKRIKHETDRCPAHGHEADHAHSDGSQPRHEDGRQGGRGRGEAGPRHPLLQRRGRGGLAAAGQQAGHRGHGRGHEAAQPRQQRLGPGRRLGSRGCSPVLSLGGGLGRDVNEISR